MEQWNLLSQYNRLWKLCELMSERFIFQFQEAESPEIWYIRVALKIHLLKETHGCYWG